MMKHNHDYVYNRWGTQKPSPRTRKLYKENIGTTIGGAKLGGLLGFAGVVGGDGVGSEGVVGGGGDVVRFKPLGGLYTVSGVVGATKNKKTSL